MKKIIILFVVGLLAQQVTQAQGTLYLSNLGQTPTGSNPVGSNSWQATDFFTGTNVGGYVLNSIQLSMTSPPGNPSGFTVMIYTEGGIVGPAPGSNLGSLNGSSNPAITGIYTYTNVSNLMLSPSTDYFIVLTAGTTIGNGAYEWSYAGVNSYSPNGGWRSEGGSFFTSSDGSHWSSGTSIGPEYAINATAVPEPSSEILLALGGLAFLWHRRKAKTSLIKN